MSRQDAQHYRGEPAGDVQGYGAMALTVLIWVAFLLSLRAEGSSGLTPSDLALMRFGTPALLLLPLLWLQRKALAAVRLRHLLMILIGGLPFFYLVSLGSQYAPAAHAGALVPGTAPLFVTGMAVLVFGEPLPRYRFWGLLVIVAGVAALLGSGLADLASGYWRGHLAFLAASLLWAFYTLGLRVAGLPAMTATALLCVGSTLGLLLLLGGGLVQSQLTAVSGSELWPFFLAQGLGAGVIGGISYGISINRLGAEKTAAIGSFTPALAAMAAIPLLGETLSLASIAGVLLIMAGVFLASGVVRLKRWRQVQAV